MKRSATIISGGLCRSVKRTNVSQIVTKGWCFVRTWSGIVQPDLDVVVVVCSSPPLYAGWGVWL